jgi:hypothetical protein
MQLQAIIEIIDYIKKEIDSKQIISRYEQLLAVIKKIGATPDTDLSAELTEARTSVISALNDTEPQNWSYSKYKLLLELDKDSIIGTRASQTLNSIFDANQANPPKIAKEIKKLIESIKKIVDSSSDALLILSNFSSPVSSLANRSLLTLFFEGKTSVQTINDIERYTRIWNGIINDFAFLTMQTECQPGIESIDKKSIVLNIPEGDKILEALSYGTGKVIETYDKILRIRVLQIEVIKLALNEEIKELLEEEITIIINRTSGDVVNELMRMNNWENRQGNEELFSKVQKSLKLVLNFIEKGGKMEFLLSNSNPEIDERNKMLVSVYDVVNEIEAKVKEIDLYEGIPQESRVF